MGNDTLCVDGDVRTLDDIEASHADEWYGDDVLVRALIAEVRRLRAVESAARVVADMGDGVTGVALDALRYALAAAPDTEGGTDG